MPEDKKEIRLDRSNEAAGEPLMPGDNTIKPSDGPSNLTGTDSVQNNNLTLNSTDLREGSPDFGDEDDATSNAATTDNL